MARLLIRALHIILMAIIAHTVAAQDTVLTGYVLELNSGEPLPYVEIKNLNTGKLAESSADGKFTIPVKKNERLQFEYPGYRTDTLVVIEFDIKRVYMTPDGSAIQIDEVQIQAMTDSRLATEIERARKEGQVAETSQHRGGLRLSPSRWLGQEGRQARLRYRLLLAEQERRKIDARFTPEAVMAVTPLKGEELELYMTKYRPTVEFLAAADESDLRLYIMDTYAKFKELTPKQRAEIKIPKRDNP
ncbi:carboxypeptidase-like regulatory domain-containing protein [Parapedobacter sp. ISTM3]|uniref:CarboxypepD_reg-like domain-containing protein n=1 Tax=Parapedobacter luteus TaxID=623280 RepID=A0A1T5BJB0_9SPHI|nr:MULTISPECIES: carboxypeptidase-like regulatory domain-containing protein [Parapedobacter]MBK1439474.1 carboxypeptidase-like regulatory domain-containing protein [Parapedobacter sp. ISTM3]SKB47090.1 CarboxypepD_reg-like domain-containing protein [Parapedobacter luteus]